MFVCFFGTGSCFFFFKSVFRACKDFRVWGGGGGGGLWIFRVVGCRVWGAIGVLELGLRVLGVVKASRSDSTGLHGAFIGHCLSV